MHTSSLQLVIFSCLFLSLWKRAFRALWDQYKQSHLKDEEKSQTTSIKKKYFLVKLKNEASYFEQLVLFEVVFSKDLESFDNDASS